MQQINRRVFLTLVATTFWTLGPLAAYGAAQGDEGYFGAQLTTTTEEESGVRILSILPESPAARAGFQRGDRIVRIDRSEFDVPQEAATYLRGAGAGTNVSMRYVRVDDAPRTTEVELGRNPWQNADRPDTTDGLFEVAIHPNLAYREDSNADADKHRLDLYVPQSDKPVPALLWIHGGGWSLGDRENERSLALRFAERGVAVAAMSYRLSAANWANPDYSQTGVTHPAHINDVADAFQWLHANAGTYGLDQRRLFAGGHSAGGHLAALLASDLSYLTDRELTSDALAGALPIGGAYDIEDYYGALLAGDPELARAHIHAVFGIDNEAWRSASPTRYIDQSTIPMLVVVEDQAGFQRYADRLREAADQAGRPEVEFLDAVGRTHSNIILLMSGRHSDAIRERMIEFITLG